MSIQPQLINSVVLTPEIIQQVISEEKASKRSSDEVRVDELEKKPDETNPPAKTRQKTFRDGTVLSVRKLLETDLKDEATTLESLLKWSILPPEVNCPNCQTKMVRKSPSQRARHPEGRFYCAGCKTEFGGRFGSIFDETRGSLKEKMLAIVYWFLNNQYTSQRRECNVSEHTLCDIRILLNAVAVLYISSRNEQIGGQFRVVEVDEAQLHRRKNGVGRNKKEIWVLGGIERPRVTDTNPPRMFLSILERRDATSIRAALRKWVLQGTIICSAAFAGYTDLEKLGYYHFDVNHKENFVDALTKAHSQRVEGMWHILWRTALPLTGTRSEDLNFYLSAFLFRRRVTVFEDFLQILASVNLQELQSLLDSRSESRKVPKSKLKKETVSKGGDESSEISVKKESEKEEEEPEHQRNLRCAPLKKKKKRTRWHKQREEYQLRNIREHSAEAAVVASTRYTNARALSLAKRKLETTRPETSDDDESKTEYTTSDSPTRPSPHPRSLVTKKLPALSLPISSSSSENEEQTDSSASSSPIEHSKPMSSITRLYETRQKTRNN